MTPSTRTIESGPLLNYARAELSVVLQVLVASQDQATREAAYSLIHGLGERGVHGLQDLL